MKDNVIFRYKNGRIIPIKVNKDITTNDYMNNKIRNKKVYTEKDMKPLYIYNRKQETRGYELNGIYLLKNHEQGKHYLTHKWLVNELDDKVPSYIYMGDTSRSRWVDENDTIKYFETFKEGKEALIKLANKKGGIK